MCTGPCALFPPPAEGFEVAIARVQQTIVERGVKQLRQPLPAICNLPLFKEICEIIFNFANNHEPLDDFVRGRVLRLIWGWPVRPARESQAFSQLGRLHLFISESLHL